MKHCFELPFVAFRISGDAEKLFNGITTNTRNGTRNALLDVYGRVVAAFYQKFEGKEVAIALSEKYSDKFLAAMKTYLMLGKCKAEKMREKVFFTTEKPTEHGILIPEKNYFIFIAEKEPKGSIKMNEEEFLCLRLENGISMQGFEFENEMIMNTDWRDAVSLTKGCFLGQEIVAKVTQRGKPPKKLVRFAFAQEPTQIPFVEIRSKCFSKKIGKWIAYCSVPNEETQIPGAEELK